MPLKFTAACECSPPARPRLTANAPTTPVNNRSLASPAAWTLKSSTSKLYWLSSQSIPRAKPRLASMSVSSLMSPSKLSPTTLNASPKSSFNSFARDKSSSKLNWIPSPVRAKPSPCPAWLASRENQAAFR